jgi:hypothetical protein
MSPSSPIMSHPDAGPAGAPALPEAHTFALLGGRHHAHVGPTGRTRTRPLCARQPRAPTRVGKGNGGLGPIVRATTSRPLPASGRGMGG